MNSPKTILIQHGEKIALAVIALICGYSLLGIFSRDSKELELPNGKPPVKVDQNQIKRHLEEANKHLGSDVKVMADPVADKTSQMLAKRILAGSSFKPQATLEWYPYVQNPPVGVPPLIKKPPVVDNAQNIPEAFRTRFGNPEDVRVIASTSAIVVVARDSKYLNYPEPGSRQMLLVRKSIGSGKEDLSPAIRTAMIASPRSATVAGMEESAAGEGAATASAGGQQASVTSAWGVKSTVAAAPTEAVKSGGDETNAEQYKERYQKADVRAFEDMKAACTPTSVVATGWELVAPRMYALKQEPTEEMIHQLVENGLSPDLVEMTPEEEAAWKAKKEAKEKAEKGGKAAEKAPEPAPVAKMADWSEITAPKVDKKPVVEAVKEVVAVPTETPRYYVFIDTNIQQNMVYRYGVMASVKPRWPDKAMLAKKEYEGWEIYAEVVGINGGLSAGGDFALPARMLKDTFEKVLPQLKKGVDGVHLSFTPCYQTAITTTKPSATAAQAPVAGAGAGADAGAAATKVEDNGLKVKRGDLRGDNGAPTPLGWAYRSQEPCYSDFVYTDLVLTPKEYEFELRSATILEAGNAQAAIRLHKVEKDGTAKQANFNIPFKIPAVRPVWSDFLGKDGKGNTLWPPKILSIQDVYGKLADLAPVAVGDKKGKDDFTSGWGIVDMRPYLIKGKRYSKDKEGNWKMVGEYPQRQAQALILCEISPPKGQPRRFLRIYRPEPQPKNENQKVEFEYDFEPELTAKIEERKKRLGENTEGGAPAAGK